MSVRAMTEAPSVCFALVLLWSAAAVANDTTVQALDSDGVVVIYNKRGQVEVTAWDRNEVAVRAEFSHQDDGLSISGNQRRLRVEPKQIGGRGSRAFKLYLQVPRGASVTIETISADVIVGAVEGEWLEVRAVSGDIEVQAEPARVQLAAISGDIDIASQSGRSEISTVSGDIKARGLRGELDVSTVSGEVELAATRVDRMRLQSVSGDLSLSIGVRDEIDAEISTLSGEVDLVLRDKISVSLSAQTFSGRISSPRGRVRSGRHGPQQHLQFVMGEGLGRIHIESHSGNIRIVTD